LVDTEEGLSLHVLEREIIWEKQEWGGKKSPWGPRVSESSYKRGISHQNWERPNVNLENLASFQMETEKRKTCVTARNLNVSNGKSSNFFPPLSFRGESPTARSYFLGLTRNPSARRTELLEKGGFAPWREALAVDCQANGEILTFGEGV